MAASNVWALVGGIAVVGGALGGVAVWKHAHPDTPLSVAVLMPPSTPAPAPSAAPPAATPPSAATPKASPMAPPPAPQSPQAANPAPAAPAVVADRGPEPPTAPNPEAAAADAPKFDIVRVEPTGEAVVAGQAKPDTKVALMADGKVVAEVKSDANGQFVMTPEALKPGDHDLSLRESPAGQPAQESKQAVAVAVPQAGKGQVVVALAEPGKATRVLSAPVAPAAVPAPAQPLGIRSAELENGNGFFATGTAPPGTKLHIYLNDSHVADVTAGPDSLWSLRIGKGLTGGRYKVRADAVGPNETVTARVEVPFDVPMAMAQAAAPAAPARVPAPVATPAPHAPSPAAALPGDDKAAAGEARTPQGPEPPRAPNPEEVAALDGDKAPAPQTPAAGEARAPQTPASKTAAALETAQAVAPQAVAPQAVSPPTVVPRAVAPQAVAPQAPDPNLAATPGANAVIAAVETALVVRGDNLWNISRTRLGEGMRYTQIYTANATQIRNPNLIYPGQVFVVPH